MARKVNSVTEGEQRVPTAVKVIGWFMVAVAFVAVAYLAWSLIPRLWHWANEAWWHWLPALFGLSVLLLAPGIAVMSRPCVEADGTDSKRRRRRRWAAFVGTVVFVLLALWAFMPRPSWWESWHWWLWGVAILAVAISTAAARMLLTVYQTDVPAERHTFSGEWRFNHDDVNSPPALGIAMSGGGIRSAAFNLGVLQALHECNILPSVDVMSAVSGGSYTMSWYLLQPFYAAQAAFAEGTEFNIDAVIDEMFDREERFQKYLSERPRLFEVTVLTIGALADLILFQLLRPLTIGAGQYNKTSMVRDEYRKGIQRLFHGRPSPESRHRIENRISFFEGLLQNLDFSDFSDVAPVSYRELAEFAEENELPFFVFNAALLVERSVRDQLWPTAFELTADDLGSDAFGYREWDNLREWEAIEEPDGYGRLKSLFSSKDRRPNQWILMANLAPAISGAAIGLSYFDRRKTPRAMKLATWTPFIGNVDLGYLFPRSIWNGKGTLYLSDGGHAENLGAYALIKRQCRTIIVVDAEHEQDTPYVFKAYCKLQKRLREERSLSLEIGAIDRYLEAAKGPDQPTGPSEAVMIGEIGEIRDRKARQDAGEEPLSTVIYIKLALDREHLNSYPCHIQDYARDNDRFPQDPTIDQIFTSDQFIAYRDLGHHTVTTSTAISGLLGQRSR